MIAKVVQQLSANPKRLFLIDSIGAVVSAFSLGGILVYFQSVFGMPREELYYLAGVACLFAVYSFFCYARLPKNWRAFLKVIAISNLIYCFISMGLVVYYFPQLTKLGVLYFIIEFAIVFVLVGIEFKVAFRLK